jgi:hypothetical protein
MRQHAQRQTVVEVVGSVIGEPAHVSGVDADGRAEDLTVEAAERARPIPRLQDRLPPGRISTTPPQRVACDVGGAEHELRVQTDRGQDVAGDGIREVRLDQRTGGRQHQPAVRHECPLQIGAKRPVIGAALSGPRLSIGTSRSRTQIL